MKERDIQHRFHFKLLFVNNLLASHVTFKLEVSVTVTLFNLFALKNLISQDY